MDAEKLLKAFSSEETRELAAALPADVLRDVVVDRGIAVPAAVGVTATQAAAAEIVGNTFETRISSFLDPETKLSADEQLATMTEFWGGLTGHKVPELTEEQKASLAEKLEGHPERRVMPTPLFDLADRKDMAEKAKIFPESQLTSSREALWAPDQSWLYGKLLRDPESTVKEGRDSYGLRYKTPEGEVVKRSAYIAAMEEAGKAVKAEDGTVWLFPVMDVQVESPREYARADTLQEKVDPTVAPESLEAMQLLHQVNGTPNPNWHVDFANEAVYKLDKKGNPVAPVSGAGVNWDPFYRLVYLDRWFAVDQYGLFGVRAAESGL